MRTITDGGLALPLARAWHAESRYGHLPFSEKKFIETVLAVLRRGERGAAFIILWQGDSIGLINVAVGEAIMSEGGCYATCLAWYVHPDAQRTLLGGRIASQLLHEATAWCVERGATDLLVHGTHGMRTGLSRRGNVVGINVVLEL